MKQLFFIISIAALFASCKKKDSPTPEPTPSTTGSTTNYAYGSMTLFYYRYYTGNSFANNDSAATAAFYSDPLYPSTSLLNAGTVSLNGNPLQYSSGNYQIGAPNIHASNIVWAVSGSSVVPAINYTTSPNFPIFTGNTQLPDSFSISSGVTISLSGISNFGTNSIYVELDDNSGGSVYKTIQPGNFSCFFSGSELASLQPTNNGMIMINLGNSTIHAFGGKNYGIGSTLIHCKFAINIKP